MKKLPIGIELFCGCGGISTGFLDAGLPVAAGFDIDRKSIEAYDYNHNYRQSRGYVADLAITSGTSILEMAGLNKVDFVIGGPPCQPFSIVGKRLGSDDMRSQLVEHFGRLVGELNPKAVFFENVPNLASVNNGEHLNALVRALRDLRYSVRLEVVTAAEYGVPQVRRRLLLVAIKGRTQVVFPEPTHGPSNALKPFVTAKDALDDLPPAGEFGECGVHNHEPTAHTPDMLQRFATLEPGKRERRSFHDRLHPDRPSYTLRAGTGNFSPLRPIHYRHDRVITVRESARLQGFGDEFVWPDWVPRLQQYRQVGNAVAPPVAATVARTIAEQVEWDLKPDALKGNSFTRPEARTMTDAERKALRMVRIRGASLGRGSL